MSDVNFIMRETSERVNHTLKRLTCYMANMHYREYIREDRRKRDERCEEMRRCFYYINEKRETRYDFRNEVRIFFVKEWRVESG